MENKNLIEALVKFLEKDGKLIQEDLNSLRNSSEQIKIYRDKIDQILEQLKISIIKSSSHLLIDKIHKGEKENVLTILNNTTDKTVFYDFKDLLDMLLVEYEKYQQYYEIYSPNLIECKERLGLNDHKLFKLINEIDLE
jgi:hypothetical protein